MTLEKFAYLKSPNADYIDLLFERYLENPDTIDPSWRYFFEGLELGTFSSDEFQATAKTMQAPAPASTSVPAVDWDSELKVFELIQAYRALGKTLADIDPLHAPPSAHPYLELSRYGLSSADLPKMFHGGKTLGLAQATLSQIIARLKELYCSRIAIEVAHVENKEEQYWLYSKIESGQLLAAPATDTRKWILKRMTESECFEKFLATRYVAQKRFSIEGAEALIPALDCAFEAGAELDAKEFVLGMAHRGRLNVLTNVMGKNAEYIFTEFEGTYKVDPAHGEGDVKYHMGFSVDLTTRKQKKVHLSLAANPSHLEFVNAVAEGVARAKQEYLGDQNRTQVVPILIHGDAAFAGQGVCYEALNLCQLEGYSTGGTLHLVINNQVGFTTNPIDSRSTAYATDLGKMINAPIFHVHGDHPEALWAVTQLAIEYRQKFKKDVFVDLVCYRRYGHNEGDEPSFTQPLMYKKIKAHPTPREAYAAALAQAGVVPETESKAWVDEQMKKHADQQAIAKTEAPHPPISAFERKWKGLRKSTEECIFKPVNTAVDEKTLQSLAAKINTMPAGFHLHPKLNRFFEARLKSVQDKKGIDWGNGETLAYATLLNEGFGVRISGQDVERGTFTHRHAVLNDSETGEKFCPLKQFIGKMQIHNSHLSETGVMGFEYGYSLAEPNVLTIWEAQFGDFANGAQVIIDQFLATGESKWSRQSGLTLLLPHGYEGQGPEHSSARLERFLQLCGRNNMSVCNLTTPAQIFHALRRQLKRDFRKPLVVMSPKSLLRHPMAISELKEFTDGGFEEALDDARFAKDAASVKRVLVCTGKVYYDLLAHNQEGVAIVRLEQLYPWPAEKLKAIFKRYSKAKEIFWVQEEPRNMGGWSYVNNQWNGGFADFASVIGDRSIGYVGRDICASPAVGSHKLHEKEQKALVERAFSS